MSDRILLLTCNNGFFGQGLNVFDSLDVEKLAGFLGQKGNHVVVRSYEEVSKRIVDYQNFIVIYSSTQRPDYKSFIEDVLLGLMKMGNLLVPRFDLFRAHENKGYQEILRQCLGIPDIRGLYYSGSYDLDSHPVNYPMVFKTVAGSSSQGVKLVSTKNDLIRIIKAEEQLPIYWQIHRLIKHFISRKNEYSTGLYKHLKPFFPFVLQEFIGGLSHDYKVLVFGNKYFVLERAVRDNDFRASGSGKFKFVEPETDLLDYAAKIYRLIDSPFLSLDICNTPSGFALIEFQGPHLGPYTILKSSFHYLLKEGNWLRQDSAADLDALYAESLLEYIANKSFA